MSTSWPKGPPEFPIAVAGVDTNGLIGRPSPALTRPSLDVLGRLSFVAVRRLQPLLPSRGSLQWRLQDLRMLSAGVRAPTHRDVARGFVPPVSCRPRRPAQPTRFASTVPLQVGPVNDGRREGTRNRRAAQRHRALGSLGLRADESLRLGSVKARTLKTYRIEVRGFRLWCRRNNVSLPRGSSLAALAVVDRALGQYVAHLYQQGFGPGKARHVMYGYIYLHTDTEGRARPFPRTVRIIEGFFRKVVTTTKSPLPKSVVYALAHKMCLKHGWRPFN